MKEGVKNRKIKGNAMSPHDMIDNKHSYGNCLGADQNIKSFKINKLTPSILREDARKSGGKI
jgi:hypothetical protein